MLSASQYLAGQQVVACQGPCGPRGACGPQGFQGNPGYSGPGGPIGYSGPLGATGPLSTVAGYTGSIGIQGYTGSTGLQGYSGPRGYTGADGQAYTGATGPQGYTGVQGYIGLQGYTGSIGTQGYSGPMGYTGVMGPSYTVKGTWQPVVGNLVNGGTNITSANINAAINTNSPLTTSPPYTTAAVGDLVYISYPGVASSLFYCYTGGTISGNNAQWVFMGNLATTAIQGSTGVQGYTGASIRGYTGADSTVVGPQGYSGPRGYTGPGSTVMGYTGPQGSTGAASIVPGIQGYTGPIGVIYSNFIGATNCVYLNQNISTTATITSTVGGGDIILFTSGTLLAGCRLDYKIVFDSANTSLYPQVVSNSGNFVWVTVGSSIISFMSNIGAINTTLATSQYVTGDIVTIITDGNIAWFYKNGIYMTQCAFSGSSFTSKLSLSSATTRNYPTSGTGTLLSFYVSGVPGSQGFPTLSKSYTAVPPGMLFTTGYVGYRNISSITQQNANDGYLTITFNPSLPGTAPANSAPFTIAGVTPGTLTGYNGSFTVTNAMAITVSRFKYQGNLGGTGTPDYTNAYIIFTTYTGLSYSMYTFTNSNPSGLYMFRIINSISGLANLLSPLFFWDGTNITGSSSSISASNSYCAISNTTTTFNATISSSATGIFSYELYLIAKY